MKFFHPSNMSANFLTIKVETLWYLSSRVFSEVFRRDTKIVHQISFHSVFLNPVKLARVLNNQSR